MYKLKPLALVALAILFGGALSNVAAQSRMPAQTVDNAPSPMIETLNGTYTMKVSASELSAGEIDFAGNTDGFTIYGVTEGDLSGFIFISINYDGPQSSKAGVTSRVSGGSWSKLIFMKGQYAGSVHGRIVKGELVWNGMGVPANISLQLTADEGTRGFAGNAGTGTLEGILDQSSKVPSVSGVLTLNY